MKCVDVFNAIVGTVVQQAESGVWYLEPLWMLEPDVAPLLDDEKELGRVEKMLELTVRKRNAEADLVHPVVDWLYKLMSEEGQYALNEGELKLMEDMMEYMKLKPEERNRKAALDGWSFAKK